MNNWWLLRAFAELDRRIDERWTAGNLSHGFWRAGTIPRLEPVDTLREYGFWQARAELINGMAGQISVALIGGHTRIGLFLPSRLLDGCAIAGESLIDTVSRSHDGQPASIVRRIGGDWLFDRIFTEAPFSAGWFRDCVEDGASRQILEDHFSWCVISIWESALRAVFSHHGNGDMGLLIHSSKPLPSTLTESEPVTFQDVYEIRPGYWVTILSPDSYAGRSAEDAEARLQELLPEHDITIQKESA
ncbi:MAG: hypothetical protein AB7T01_02375 [Acidithiobacillus sp.]